MRHTRPQRVRATPRRKGGGGLVLLAAIALLATGVATQNWWREFLPVSVARAADTGVIPPLMLDAPTAKIAAFDAPRDYLILPAGGALTVPLRTGPGDSYDEVARLGLHDAVVGRGTSNTPGTTDWVWVTRSSDGLAGYINQNGLLDRSPVAKTELAEASGAGRSGIDTRYQQLLGKASGLDRTYLIDGQHLWEAQRRRCEEGPDPAGCRKQLDARRMADLDDWRSAGEARPEPTRPITEASFSALR